MDTERHPKGLYVLFFTEMWERFGFYSMLAMFTLYLKDGKQGFGWSSEDATHLYANYLMFVYASPLVGGWIADKKLGYRNSVMLGGVIFMVGYFLLSIHDIAAVYAALVCLVVGNGFFKPNVSAMVGHQYPEGSKLKDRAYNIFYMGINVGALLAPINAEIWVGKIGYNNAFAIAGFGMILSVSILWYFKHLIEGAKPQQAKSTGESARPSAIEQVPEVRRIFALIGIFIIVIVFWMVFHQNGSTLTYWADDNTDWNVSGIIANAINPFWVVTLTFPVVWMWSWLNKRNLEPSTPAKMAMGMFLVAIAFTMFSFAARRGESQEITDDMLANGAFRVTDRTLEFLAANEVPKEIIEDLNRKNSSGKSIIKGKKFKTDRNYEDALTTIKQRFADDLEQAKADHRRHRDEDRENQDWLREVQRTLERTKRKGDKEAITRAEEYVGLAKDRLEVHRERLQAAAAALKTTEQDVKVLKDVEISEGVFSADTRPRDDTKFADALEQVINHAYISGEKTEQLSTEGADKIRTYKNKTLTGQEKLHDALARRGMLGNEDAPKYRGLIERYSYLFKMSPLWLIFGYMLMTLGELMLSPMGLSLVSKVAPVHLRGLMMGGWFVATAIGNKLTAIGVYWEIWMQSTFFLVLGLMAAGVGVILVLLLRPLKKAMPGV
jgi:POT family proton-dependent oligopeptide transporter